MSKLSSPAEYEDDIVEGSGPLRLLVFLPYLLILACPHPQPGLLN
jgi:hypothetical protein